MTAARTFPVSRSLTPASDHGSCRRAEISTGRRTLSRTTPTRIPRSVWTRRSVPPIRSHALDRLGDDAKAFLLEQQTELFAFDEIDGHRTFPNRLALRLPRESARGDEEVLVRSSRQGTADVAEAAGGP